MAKKYYLDQAGLEKLVTYINDALGGKANVGDIPENVVLASDLAAYALKTDIPEALDLSGYATKDELEDYATDDDLAALAARITGVYHFRGTVDNLAALQEIENPQVGDVYNLTDTGMNAAWTGEVWDEFGQTIDLSPYALDENIQPIASNTINSILYSGSSAVVSDIESIEAMFANDEPKVTVILNKNLTVTDLEIPEDKEVVLDLGGNTVTATTGSSTASGIIVNGNLTLKNGTVAANNRAIGVRDGGEFVLDGAEITAGDCAIDAVGTEANVVIKSGAVTAQEAGVLVLQGANLEIQGGTITGLDNCPIMGNGTAGKGGTNIVMNGGTLVGHIQSNGYIACGVYLPNDGSFVMNGGEIISDGAGVVMRGGSATFNGGSITATGTTGVKGKVGDSQVTVGPYAIVYEAKSRYPAYNTLELTLNDGIELQGTDGELDVLLGTGIEANITDNRTSSGD